MFRKIFVALILGIPFKCTYLKILVYETLQKVHSVLQILEIEDGLQPKNKSHHQEQMNLEVQ